MSAERNPECWQINLQEGFGGGEVYTVFLTKALAELGVRSYIFVSPRAKGWQRELPPGTQVIPIANPMALLSHLPAHSSWILSHGGLVPSLGAEIAARHLLTGIAHMPLPARNAQSFAHHDLVFPVSCHVRETLRASLRREQVYEFPLYGVARHDLGSMDANQVLHQNTRFDWDRRKGRDRLLGWLQPVVAPCMRRPAWTPRPGITLGIVSRLTPIKQFPLLFSTLVPALLEHAEFNLEVVGSGGYASVRDLSSVLKPLGHRVRYWGHQKNVLAVYRRLDYLMTGLPEKEALGLNVIEAQACGLPVLAVNAPPFTETVVDQVTGLLYSDPRDDQGASFRQLLQRLAQQPFRVDTALAKPHLESFSSATFTQRIRGVLDFLGGLKRH